MSTAGKVLSVLTILLAMVWVVLTSAVAEYNRAGTRAVEKVKADLVTAEAAYRKTVAEIQTAKDETDKQQVQTQSEQAAAEARRLDREKERSQALQLASRFKLQAEGAEASLEAATTLDEERLAEKEAETKAREDAKALVEKLKGQNDEMLAKLTGLREKFSRTLQANKEMTNRLDRAGGTSPASSPRPSRTTSRPAAPGAPLLLNRSASASR